MGLLGLELDLSNTNDWMSNNILELNDDKSTVMFIARPNTLQATSELQVFMNCRPLKRVCETKLLGV
jgi:hypothetical protein